MRRSRSGSRAGYLAHDRAENVAILPRIDGTEELDISDDYARFLFAAKLFLLMDAVTNIELRVNRTLVGEQKRIAALTKETRRYVVDYSKRKSPKPKPARPDARQSPRADVALASVPLPRLRRLSLRPALAS